MEPKMQGLQSFHNSLYVASGTSLRKQHPEFVDALFKAIKETKDLSQAVDKAKAIPTDTGFAKWRPLLTAILDTELAIRQVGMALDLLRITPPPNFGILPGEWVYYHLNVWAFWVDGLLERTKKLINKAIRSLVRPQSAKWKGIEDDLLRTIRLLSEDIGKMRDPLAHGGGAVEMIEKERLWEGFMVLALDVGKYDLPLNQVLGRMDKYQTKWYAQLAEKTALLLNEIDKTIAKLNNSIDWDKSIG